MNDGSVVNDSGGGGVGQAGTERAKITKLPALVVNQIAAGEVVERPASVVKELIDNALDAGATRVVVEIEAGGVELIRVIDDGAGVAEGELLLAVEPHATSKIRSVHDLDAIATMGFRGEALASIASVSRFEMRSRRATEPGGASVRVEGGGEPTLRPASGAVGTSVSVRNLFFNTPARRKFLKTPTTERGHCIDAAKALAMAHPGVGFRVVADGKTMFDVPPGQSARRRALALVGEELESQLLEVSHDRFEDDRGLTMWGLIGTPELARPTTKRQHVFLNGRPIRDKTIQHAVREAYRGLIEPGRHPMAILMLEMTPAGVDVNVHPQKTEVRFRDQGMVHRAVYLAVKAALGRADITPTDRGSAGAWRFERDDRRDEHSWELLSEDERRQRTAALGFSPTNSPANIDERAPNDLETMRHAFQAEREQIERDRAAIAAERAQLESRSLSGEHLRASRVRDADGQSSMPAASPVSRALQLHNSFLVTQDERGLVIIDQHALHERVMFEILRRRMEERGSLESQHLLVPAIVEVTGAQAEALDSVRETLTKLGVEADQAGPSSVAVRAYPTFLAEKNVEPASFMGELLDRASDDGFASGEEAALHEVLDMMACKAAVKAGDRLSEAELDEMLRLRAEVERSGRCPHGRPTTIRLTVEELERQFGRG